MLTRLWHVKHVSVLLVLGCLLAGCGEQSQPAKEESARAAVVLVSLYCLYGSQSEAQFDGCIHHVSASYVAHAHTPAARFARAEPLVCGPGSGPRCSVREAIRMVHAVENQKLP